MRFLGSVYFFGFFLLSQTGAGQLAPGETTANNTQSQEVLLQLLMETHQKYYREPAHSYVAQLNDFLGNLKARQLRCKSEEQFLAFLFYKVHRKFLKFYNSYSTFDHLLARGYYDCLTGTALYAYLLEGLGLEYEIFETKYHIYLVVHAQGKNILFESTDPLNGFVNDPKEINDRVKAFEEDNLNGKSNGAYYEFKADIFDAIDFMDLVGLLYYNQAVDAYNQQNFSTAIFHLEKAAKLYPSKRIEELTLVILEAIRWDKTERGTSNVSKLNSLHRAIASR